MRRERGVRRVRQEGLVLDSVGFETVVLEVGLDVAGGFQGWFCSGEVRMQSEGAEVGSHRTVGGRGEESLAETESISLAGKWGCRVWIMQGIKTQNAEDENEEEEGARGLCFCCEHGGCWLRTELSHFNFF